MDKLPGTPQEPEFRSEKPLSIAELLKEYGQIDAIPENALEAAGFVRLAEGRVVRADYLPRLQEKAERVKRPPFEVVELNLTRSVQGRRIYLEDCKRLENELDELLPQRVWGSSLEFSLAELPQSDAISSLETLGTRIEQLPVWKGLVSNGQRRNLLLGLFDHRLEVLFEECHLQVEKHFNEAMDQVRAAVAMQQIGDDGLLSSDQTLQLAQKIERLRGEYGDSDRYQAKFEAGLALSPLAILDEDEELTPRMESFIAERPSYFALGKQLFSDVLRSVDLEGAASRLETAPTVEAALGIIRAERCDVSEEERSLRKHMRTASLEEKQALSQQLKAFDQKRNVQRGVLRSLTHYYSMPEIVAQHAQRILKSMQSHLIRGADQSNVTYRLDARPDPVLDKDPGEVSGDCTIGSPLPFKEPTVPVFNVKVFESKRHVGNIYLLESYDLKDRERRVWHLDAIQIPDALDWKTAIESLFHSLLQQARDKGVSGLTVSTSAPQISNYDYISSAVLRYCEQRKLGQIEIEVPVPPKRVEKYSPFQTDGRVFYIPTHQEGVNAEANALQ